MMLIFLNGWATFDRKMGVATTCASSGLGPTNSIKQLDHRVELLGQPLSRNRVFKIFRPVEIKAYNSFIILFMISYGSIANSIEYTSSRFGKNGF